MIKIRRINIYESPILSVTHKDKTVHIVLDTGVTASLISLAKANELKLKILPTIHRAVQVNGVSDLKVLGEIHTEFQRGNLGLQFSALVVNVLGADLLGGTNIHKENDIYLGKWHKFLHSKTWFIKCVAILLRSPKPS